MKTWMTGTQLGLSALLAFAACSGDDTQEASGAGASGASSAAGGDTSAGSGGAGTKSGTCADMATAICGKVKTCMPFIFKTAYEDQTACIQRNTDLCTLSMDAPGTGFDKDDFKPCAIALAEATCDEFFAAETGGCTAKPGSHENGDGCGVDAQCESGNCAVDGLEVCGACAPVVEAGEDCSGEGDVCASGTVCAPESKRCVKPKKTGQDCDADAPCVIGLVCLGGSCRKPAQEGDECSQDIPCDFLRGLHCVEGACAEIPISDVGEACGTEADSFAACRGGTSCVGDICVPALDDGDSCDMTADDQPFCLAPAACVSGECKLPDPAICN